MSIDRIEEHLPLIKQQWDNFIHLVNQDLKELNQEIQNLNTKIQKTKDIITKMKKSPVPIEFLINNREIFLEVYPSLQEQFQILNAFNERNNLDNDLAVITYQKILSTIEINKVEAYLATLTKNCDILVDKIKSYIELINVETGMCALISELCHKYNISLQAERMIQMYPTIVVLKNDRKLGKYAVAKSAKDEDNQEQVAPSSISTEINTQEKSSADGKVEILKELKEEVFNFKALYETQLERYNNFKNSLMPLLNKYYIILQGLKPFEYKFYRAYCSYSDIELENMDETQSKENCTNALSKIYSMKAFDAKLEIEKLMKSIVASNYSNEEEIKFLERYIDSFEKYCKKLQEIDNQITGKIVDKEGISIDELKVFFLTDRSNGNTLGFIPEEIRNGDSFKKLIEEIEKGDISSEIQLNYNKGLNTMLYAINKSDIIVSYIKVNSDEKTSGDESILILTASPSTGGIDGIREATSNVIKGNIPIIDILINSIKRKNPQMLALQLTLRDEILQSKGQNIGEGEGNGPKFG